MRIEKLIKSLTKSEKRYFVMSLNEMNKEELLDCYSILNKYPTEGIKKLRTKYGNKQTRIYIKQLHDLLISTITNKILKKDNDLEVLKELNYIKFLIHKKFYEEAFKKGIELDGKIESQTLKMYLNRLMSFTAVYIYTKSSEIGTEIVELNRSGFRLAKNIVRAQYYETIHGIVYDYFVNSTKKLSIEQFAEQIELKNIQVDLRPFESGNVNTIASYLELVASIYQYKGNFEDMYHILKEGYETVCKLSDDLDLHSGYYHGLILSTLELGKTEEFNYYYNLVDKDKNEMNYLKQNMFLDSRYAYISFHAKSNFKNADLREIQKIHSFIKTEPEDNISNSKKWVTYYLSLYHFSQEEYTEVEHLLIDLVFNHVYTIEVLNQLIIPSVQLLILSLRAENKYSLAFKVLNQFRYQSNYFKNDVPGKEYYNILKRLIKKPDAVSINKNIKKDYLILLKRNESNEFCERDILMDHIKKL